MRPWLRARYYCDNVGGGCSAAKSDHPFSSEEFSEHRGVCPGEGCGRPLIADHVNLAPRWAALGALSLLPLFVAVFGVRAVLFPPLLENVRFVSEESETSDDVGVLGVTLVREGATGEPVSVRVAATNGAAKEGSDYQLPATTLDFQPGEREKKLLLTILPDSTYQKPHRDFFLVLGNVAGRPRHVVRIRPKESLHDGAEVALQSVRAASTIAADIASYVMKRRVLGALLVESRERVGEFTEYRRALSTIEGNLMRARERYLQLLGEFKDGSHGAILTAMDQAVEELRRKGFEQQARATLLMKSHLGELLGGRDADMDRWAQELSTTVESEKKDSREESSLENPV